MMPLEAWQRVLISSTEAFVYLSPHIMMAYLLMYIVIPRFIVKGKYIASAIAVAAICMLTGFLSALLSVFVLDAFKTAILPDWAQLIMRNKNASIWLAQLAGLRGAITIGGMAAAIKLMKHWWLKEQRNMELQNENVAAQLQLLKAQVHPHFLFNTLNNIYSYTQNTSPEASKLVMGLSDMLRYMLYETNQPTVPLSKELKMIQDYIALEKIRYSNSLEIHLDLPKNSEGLYIAPLLLLPFVENAFKHGTSHVIEHPWISLSIEVEGNYMKMKLLNGKPLNFRPQAEPGGIGIVNATKRLWILYPERHALEITDEEDVFIVNLRLHLDRKRIRAANLQNPEISSVHA